MIKINLLPPEEKKIPVKVSPNLPYIIGTIVGSLSFIGAIVVWSILTNKKNVALVEYVRLKEIYLNYKPKVDEINKKIEQYEILKREIKEAEGLSEVRMKKIRLISEIPKVVPPYAWLEKIDFSSKKCKMEGYAYNNLVIADLVSNLNNSPLFVDVKLEEIKGVKYKGKNFVKFLISFRLKE